MDNEPQSAPHILAELLQLAANERKSGDWGGLLTAAERLREMFPDQVAGYRYGAQALAQTGDLPAAELLLEAGMKRFRRHPGLAQDYARLATRRNDPRAAIHRWEMMRRRIPTQPMAALGAAQAYRAIGRKREADRVLSGAAAQFPANFAVLKAWADIALEQGDWREAIERLAVMRAKFPNNMRGYVGAATALRALNKCDEADAITQEGLLRRPKQLELMVANASNAFRRGDFPQAEQRWRAVLACHGAAAIGYVGLASALQKQQRPDDYEAVLREGMAALPGNRHLMERFAAAATQRGDWAEAAQRWRRYVLRFPQDGTGHQQLGVALKQLGRLEEADHALGAGLALVPGCLPLALEHAWCAQAANNWAEALRRWRALCLRFPNDMAAKEGLLNAQLGAAEAGLDTEAAGMAAEPPPDPHGDASPESVFAQFESMGESCEFGLVQRQYGLEPISLFRWVSISMQGLIRALEHGLGDLGNPDHTELVVHPPGLEYFVRDSFYRFGMHSFVNKGTVPEDRFLQQQHRRLRFLGRKFLEDLQTGERIFIHFRKEAAESQTVLRLNRAMRRLGNATLLFVKLADGVHQAGDVVPAEDGLMIGYIDRFGKVPPSGWDIAFDTWLRICRNALELRAKLAALRLAAETE